MSADSLTDWVLRGVNFRYTGWLELGCSAGRTTSRRHSDTFRKFRLANFIPLQNKCRYTDMVVHE